MMMSGVVTGLCAVRRDRLVVLLDPTTNMHRNLIVEFSARQRGRRSFKAAGTKDGIVGTFRVWLAASLSAFISAILRNSLPVGHIGRPAFPPIWQRLGLRQPTNV
jgi:hypothetical protein